MDRRSLGELGGRPRGAGGPWGSGGILHHVGPNVDPNEIMWDTSAVGEHSCAGREVPLAVPKAAANTIPPRAP